MEAAVATTGRALESGASALLPFSDKLTAPVDGVASCACRMVPTALPVAHAAAAEPHDRLTPSHDQQPLHRQLPHFFPASQALLSAQDDPPSSSRTIYIYSHLSSSYPAPPPKGMLLVDLVVVRHAKVSHDHSLIPVEQ